MQLTHVEVHNVRAIGDASLDPHPAVNLLVGDNAAGKTSVLESIHLVSTGRSFTTPAVDRVIRKGSDSLMVTARGEDGTGSCAIGIRRSRTGDAEIRLDGRRLNTLAELAGKLPLQALHPRSDELIHGGPSGRRRYVDWGVFHVEQQFFSHWQRYRRSLAQRNAVLRAAGTRAEVEVWDTELVECGEAIHRLRSGYVHELSASVDRLSRLLFEHDAVQLDYQPGWSQEHSLAEQLVRGYARDARLGQTGTGPHRADLKITLSQREARTGASRGEQKLLVYVLKLAQIEHFIARVGQRCILLLDDLPSELDSGSKRRVLTTLGELDVQLFVTAIDRESLAPIDVGDSAKVFHVKQGELQELV